MSVDLQSIDRIEVITLACRLGWPRCTYGRIVLEGEDAWKSAAMPYGADRRQLFDQLTALSERAK